MSLFDIINADMKTAMKEQNKAKLNAIRAIKSELLLLKTDAGGKEITEADELKVLKKLAKQRRESAELYEQQGRQDLADNERVELSFIEPYLPEQLSDDELKAIVARIITDLGVSSPSETGKVMAAAVKQLAGKADNKTISDIVKKLLS